MAQHLLWLELPHRPRQVIEIAQEMTGTGLSELAVGPVIRDAGSSAPVSAVANLVSELEQVSSPSKRTTLSSSGTWARV